MQDICFHGFGLEEPVQTGNPAGGTERKDAGEVSTKDAKGREAEEGEEDFHRIAEFQLSGEWVLSEAVPAFPGTLRAFRVLR